MQALGLPVPRYGHVSLLVGADGAPLSKRHGATTVREYREQGFTAAALCNLLFRLGHSSPENGLLDLAAMARAFDPAHLGRASAHFDPAQLRVWQKESVKQMSTEQIAQWLAPQLPPQLPPATRSAFVEAVRPNVVLPEDAREWRQIVFGGMPALAAAEQAVIEEAGKAFFAAAAQAAGAHPGDFKALAGTTGTLTGRKGKALYQPLRVALTGLTHGPELAAASARHARRVGAGATGALRVI